MLSGTAAPAPQNAYYKMLITTKDISVFAALPDDDEDANEKIDKLGSINDDDVVKVASTTIPTVNAAPEQPVVVASTLPVPSHEADTPEPLPERPPLATVPQPYVP